MQVLRDRHLGALFEFHIHLLPFADLACDLVERGQDTRQVLVFGLQEVFIRKNEHDIARQDSRIFPEQRVYGRFAPTQGRCIHDIVVYQGEVVEDFDGVGQGQGLFYIGPVQPIAEHGHSRAQALTAQLQDIVDGCIQTLRAAGKRESFSVGFK